MVTRHSHTRWNIIASPLPGNHWTTPFPTTWSLAVTLYPPSANKFYLLKFSPSPGANPRRPLGKRARSPLGQIASTTHRGQWSPMRFPNRAVIVLNTRCIALKFQNKPITGGSTGSDIFASFKRSHTTEELWVSFTSCTYFYFQFDSIN